MWRLIPCVICGVEGRYLCHELVLHLFRADYAGFPSWAEMLQISYGLGECFVVNAAWSRVSGEAFPETTWSKSGFRVGDGAKSEGR